MTGNLHRRMKAIEAAEHAKRAATPESRDLSHLTDYELDIFQAYAQRLVYDPTCDREKLLAEALEKFAYVEGGQSALSAGDCSTFNPLLPRNVEQIEPGARARTILHNQRKAI